MREAPARCRHGAHAPRSSSIPRRALTGWALALTLALSSAPGCGLGLLQTAKTTPKGQMDITLGGGYIHNDLNEARDGISLSNLPVAANLRVGVTDQVDVGARLFFLAGLLADAKVNLLPASGWAGVAGGERALVNCESPAAVVKCPIINPANGVLPCSAACSE